MVRKSLENNIVESIRRIKGEWIKLWSAKGSLHFDSNLGEVYTKIKHFRGKPAFSTVVFFYNEGITACWVAKSEMDDFGKRLSSAAHGDSAYVANISEELISCAKKITAFIGSHDAMKITPAWFNDFWELVRNYYLHHISVKYIVDYLSAEELKTAMPMLEKARLFSEPIYRDLENHMAAIAEKIANDVSYAKEMILSTSREELQSYFKKKELPDSVELANRHRKSSLIFMNNKSDFIVGDEVDKLEKIFFSQADIEVIKGQAAYKGIVKGNVRIVLNPAHSAETFPEGDILVTGMTRPEFLQIMKKSGGVITDAGGILSHAAIMARELKKPCVMDTKNATKILKDGDFVELDANKGEVRIIRKNK